MGILITLLVTAAIGSCVAGMLIWAVSEVCNLFVALVRPPKR